MTFSPDLALAYVRELSADYRAGVILDAHGTVLAGDERLARAAREIAGGTAGESGADPSGDRELVVFEGAANRGKVFAARSATHLIVVTTGPFALPRVVRRDLLTALAGMGAESAQGTRLQRIPHGTVEALLDPPD